MSSSEYCQPLLDLFEANRDESKAAPMKAYMKGKADYYGVKSPERRLLFSQFFKSAGLPDTTIWEDVIQDLWSCDEREMQYIAQELAWKCRKYWSENTIDLIEHLIITKSWWDTVDYVAAWLAGHYFKLYPANRDQITQRWITSDDMWLRRSALLFQLKYKKDTDTELLFNYIRLCNHEEEFFIRKAIGWTLRDYSKFDPQGVLDFVNRTELKPLSRKEAIRNINL